MFVSSQLSVHILRGVEPNLRYGGAIKNFVDRLSYESKSIPKCPLNDNKAANAADDLSSGNLNRDRLQDERQHQCIRLASRKQIGDAIIRYEDKSIIHK